jgi:hypothetical protein
MEVTESDKLAYYDTLLITAVERFILQSPGQSTAIVTLIISHIFLMCQLH